MAIVSKINTMSSVDISTILISVVSFIVLILLCLVCQSSGKISKWLKARRSLNRSASQSRGGVSSSPAPHRRNGIPQSSSTQNLIALSNLQAPSLEPAKTANNNNLTNKGKEKERDNNRDVVIEVTKTSKTAKSPFVTFADTHVSANNTTATNMTTHNARGTIFTSQATSIGGNTIENLTSSSTGSSGGGTQTVDSTKRLSIKDQFLGLRRKSAALFGKRNPSIVSSNTNNTQSTLTNNMPGKTI